MRASALRRTADGGRAVGHQALLSLLSLVVLLLSIAALAAFPALASSSSSGPEPVYFLNAMYSLDSYTTAGAHAIWEGISAAFYASGYTAAGGRPLKIVERDPSVNASDIAAVIAKAFADYPTMLGVIGPYSDASLTSALQSDTVTNNKLTCMGPFTGSSLIRVWNSNVYFTRAEPLVELNAIINYIVNTYRAKRVAYVYLRGAAYGAVEYKALQATLASLSRNASALYAVPYSTTNTAVNQTAFTAMAATNPQVIVVWGVPGEQVSNIAKQLFTDARTSSSIIIGCFALQQILFEAYIEVTTAGLITARNDQLIISTTTLPPTGLDAGITHMDIFSNEMANFIVHSGKSQYTLPTDSSSSSESTLSIMQRFYLQRPSDIALMIEGWMAGRVIQQTLNRGEWITDRDAFQAGIFNQNRYVIGGDFIIGDYGGPCNPLAKAVGAMCSCNQGGHTGFLVRLLNNDEWKTLYNSAFSYTQADCYSSDTTFPRPLNLLSLSMTDNDDLAAATLQLSTLLPQAFRFLNVSDIAVNYAVLNATTETQQQVLDTEVGNFTVDIITGPVSSALDVGNLLVAAPYFPRPTLTIAKQNYIFTMPTLAQEIYILYANLARVVKVAGDGSTSTSLNVVLHGYDASDVAKMSSVITSTAATFGMSDPPIVTVASSDDVSGALSSTAVNLVVGISQADRVVVPAYLTANPSAIIVVDYKDLSLAYRPLLALFSQVPATVQRRFISFTNMPLWSDTSDTAHAASELLTLFHEMIPETENHTPAYLENMLCAGFLRQLLDVTTVINSTSLLSTLYRNGVITSRGLNFGQFVWSCTTTATGETCTHQNYGARDIVALSMERIINPTVSNTIDAITPSMVYTARPVTRTRLTRRQLAGIIAGSVVGGMLLIALLAGIFYCCLDNRNNDAAPKDSTKPVTLIFTDIESSTALWAALPQLMPDAVAAHHRLIRQLIKKYKCYEVKTIGDCFMIACKDAFSAVQLASDIQVRLLSYDWKTQLIDESYRQFELQKQEDILDYKPPTARLNLDVYEALWNGLRVRMGIHTGLSDIRYDEVTKGYDYYGDTSNMAARTEAIANGGQVIMTETTWWAMSDPERGQLDYKNMGPQGLRGVPYAVEMYQLNPIVGRQYADLRTEIEAILPDDGDGDYDSSAADALLSTTSALSGPAAGVALVLSGCFAPYPLAQRVRELQPLLTKWNVAVPPRNSRVSEEDYCQGLINRLAVRVSTVTAARQRLLGGGGDTATSATVSGATSTAGHDPLRAATPGRGSNATRCSTFSTTLTAAPVVEGRSAMRESRVFRGSAVAFAEFPADGVVNNGHPASHAGTDAATPFGATTGTQRGSVAFQSVAGDTPGSTEGRTLRHPPELRRRHGSATVSGVGFADQ